VTRTAGNLCSGTPAWSPGQSAPASTDWAGQEEQQYARVAQGVLSFVEGDRLRGRAGRRRQQLLELGGNNALNEGVDYARLLAGSVHAQRVRALYRTAGLGECADLDSLTEGAAITAAPAAVLTAQRTSSAGQGLGVPPLDVYPVADQLVPVERERQFGTGCAPRRQCVAAAGLRRAPGPSHGHHRRDGRRPARPRIPCHHRPVGRRRDPAARGLDGAAYVSYRPAALTVGRDAPARATRR
jgi:hypothetical protein